MTNTYKWIAIIAVTSGAAVVGAALILVAWSGR